MGSVTRDLQKKADDVLNDKQRGRIKEIGLQLRGPAAAFGSRSEVAEELKLTRRPKILKVATISARIGGSNRYCDAFGGGWSRPRSAG